MLSGRPVRGRASNTVSRYDASRVSCPSQNGDDPLSASMCGRKYAAWFIRSIRRSSSSIPIWMCIPQITIRQAVAPMSDHRPS